MSAGNRRRRQRPDFKARERKQQSKCPATGKRSWLSQEQALTALTKMRRRKPGRVYLCNHCGRWHITSR